MKQIQPALREYTRSPLTILVVDDIPENLSLLEDVLQDEGYRTLTTTSSEEALRIADQDQVHLVIADALMPKMDGLQLCRNLRARAGHARTPFIIYTGNYVDDEDRELARSVGVDRYVMKFEGTRALVDAVNDLALQQYGFQLGEEGPVAPAPVDDKDFLERHHSLVVKKLEEKMLELQVYAETLEQKNRELAISEKRYHSLFDNVGAAIMVVDMRQRRIVDVNRQAIALVGCNAEDCLGMDRLPLRDEQGRTIEIADLPDMVAKEAILTTREGDEIDVDLSAASVEIPNDTRLMVFIRDITEQKRWREQMMQTEKMALMGRLAAGVAHEIRNPLAGVTLNIQYLSMKIPVNSPERESIDAALEGTQRIQQVIEDTLGLARVSPPALNPESVNDVIERVLPFLRVPLKQKRLTLETHYGGPLPLVTMDAKQIQQVLLNILQNAIDASPAGSEILLHTQPCLLRPPDGEGDVAGVEVTIRDHGPGLPPEILPHVFRGFRTTKEGGTGLGLMLSKFIIDRHRGRIHLENAPDGGTIVRLQFMAHESGRDEFNVEG